MVADKIDMSLDDIIANKKKGRGRGRGGRGGSRGGRGSGRGSGGFNRRGGDVGPTRRGRGGNRNTPYNRPKNIPDRWEHDMYDGAGRSSMRAEGGLSTGTHLQISNLDFGVTESDVKELFSEFGKLKKAIINYDSSGRSHGTADVVYERRTDAISAMKKYNGVPLDGRPMKIEQVSSEVTNVGRRENSGSYRGNRGNNRSNSRSGGFRGSSRGGRGRGNSRGGSSRGARGRGRQAPPSKDDLDKDLDSYIDSGN